MRTLPILAAVLLAATASAQSALSFNAERHDFGTLVEGESPTHTFSFVNTGTAPLTLTDVQASCGCTTPSFSTEPVAPGETGHVSVRFDSQGRPGPFEKTVAVVPDGDPARTVLLRIVGNVHAAFAAGGTRAGSLVFEATSTDAGEIAAGDALQKAFRFQNLGDAPVRIVSARTEPAGLNLVYPERPTFAGDVGAVLVTAESPAALARPDGTVSVTVTLETTDAEEPTKTLRLQGHVASGS